MKNTPKESYEVTWNRWRIVRSAGAIGVYVLPSLSITVLFFADLFTDIEGFWLALLGVPPFALSLYIFGRADVRVKSLERAMGMDGTVLKEKGL